MKKYFKLGKKSNVLLFILFLVNTTIAASDCGVFQVMKNKSHGGVNVTENKCNSSEMVSLGTVFELPPQSRLWLKSASDMSEQYTQIICQSRSSTTVKLEITDVKEPWVLASGVSCNGWIKNRLSCDGESGQRNAFFCAVSEVNRLALNNSKMERTTSVKIRGIKLIVNQQVNSDKDKADKIEKVLTLIKDEAGLCRDLFQPKQEVEIGWELVAGKAINVNVFSPDGTEELFTDCVKDVVLGFDYPKNLAETKLQQNF